MTGFFVNYNDKVFGECECCKQLPDNKEYIPVFGVGDIAETNIWACNARPLKLSDTAVNYFDIKNVEDIEGKIVGVIRRIEINGEKINEYHCPTYKLTKIEYSHHWDLSVCTIECLKTGETEKINTSRVCVPEMKDKTT